MSASKDQQNFEPEKMILGVIYHDAKIRDAALDVLCKRYGPIEDASEEFSFSRTYSDYYDAEIGGECFRRIYSFRDTVDPSRQAQIKIDTNRIEESFSVDGKRRINLDPGFMNAGRLLLATTKPGFFRIPLSDGIYSELTLIWSRGAWQTFFWTYRDYQSESVHAFLRGVRAAYLDRRKHPADGRL